jgi:hypothetical protein
MVNRTSGVRAAVAEGFNEIITQPFERAYIQKMLKHSYTIAAGAQGCEQSVNNSLPNTG